MSVENISKTFSTDKKSEKAKTSRFRKAFNSFKDLSSEGGIVIAQYNPREFYWGNITPRTPIKKLDLKDKKGLKVLQITNFKGPFN